IDDVLAPQGGGRPQRAPHVWRWRCCLAMTSVPGHLYASERSAPDGAIPSEGCQSRNRARTTSGAHPLCSVRCSVDARGKGAKSCRDRVPDDRPRPMSKVDKPTQDGAEAREIIALLRNTVLAMLAGGLCILLWAAGMLLPSNLTTATVPRSWVKYGVETSQWSF